MLMCLSLMVEMQFRSVSDDSIVGPSILIHDLNIVRVAKTAASCSTVLRDFIAVIMLSFLKAGRNHVHSYNL